MRKYKKHGERFYPSTEGVTCNYFHFKTLVEKSYLKYKNVNDPAVAEPYLDFYIHLPSERNPLFVYSGTCVGIREECGTDELIITFSDCDITLKREYKCRSGRTYSYSVTLNDEQWSQLFAQSKSVLSCVCDMKFKNADFKQVFELIHGKPVIPSADGDKDGIMYENLKFIIKSDFFSALCELSELYNPLAVDAEELSKNSIHQYNEAVMKLTFFELVKRFHKSVIEYPRISLVPNGMIHYVTVDFLNSINMSEIIKEGRSSFCIDDK